jgi:hypothetical protein
MDHWMAGCATGRGTARTTCWHVARRGFQGVTRRGRPGEGAGSRRVCGPREARRRRRRGRPAPARDVAARSATDSKLFHCALV